MKVSFTKYTENEDYQSQLICNSDFEWDETLYFTFYTPAGESEEKLYAGRYQSNEHRKNKSCKCVRVFDFHRWDEKMLRTALELDLPELEFEKPLAELLQEALDQLAANPDGFEFKAK